MLYESSLEGSFPASLLFLPVWWGGGFFDVFVGVNGFCDIFLRFPLLYFNPLHYVCYVLQDDLLYKTFGPGRSVKSFIGLLLFPRFLRGTPSICFFQFLHYRFSVFFFVLVRVHV